MQSNGDILNLNKDNQRLQQSDGNIKRAILRLKNLTNAYFLVLNEILY